MTPEAVRGWARHAVDSPLYVHLAGVIADDPDLLGIAGRIVSQPQLNILLAGVQLILARDPSDPLAAWYPNLTAEPRPPDDALGREFRRFVADHEDEITRIGATRYAQTNEARRAVALLPAVWTSGWDRFHLVDVGASAGLNLALDRYRYRWGRVEWGDSPLLLEAGSRGADPRPRPIEIGRRIGLDLNPLDPSNPDDRAWLEALIWPEDGERRRRFRAAVAIASGVGIEMVAGDASATIAGVVGSLPAGEPVVVMDSFTLNQFSPAQLEAFDRAVAEARETRPVYRVSMGETWRDDGSSLRVDDGSGPRQIGWAHHHGRWVELYDLP